jgi:hypothetical protein
MRNAAKIGGTVTKKKKYNDGGTNGNPPKVKTRTVTTNPGGYSKTIVKTKTVDRPGKQGTVSTTKTIPTIKGVASDYASGVRKSFYGAKEAVGNKLNEIKANRSEKVSAPSERQQLRAKVRVLKEEKKDSKKAGSPTINPLTGGSMRRGGMVTKKKRYDVGGGMTGDPKKPTTSTPPATTPPAPMRGMEDTRMMSAMKPNPKMVGDRQAMKKTPPTGSTSMIPKPGVQSTPPVAEETMSARDRIKKAGRIDNKMDRLKNKSHRIQSRYNNSTNEKRERRLLDKVYAIGDKRGALRKERDALTNYTEASMSKGGMVKKKMAKGGPVISSPIQTRLGNKPMAGGNMAKGGGVKHPGFKAVQAKIAAKQGLSKKAAGAILAAGTRKASAKAKAANPRLKRVKG